MFIYPQKVLHTGRVLLKEQNAHQNLGIKSPSSDFYGRSAPLVTLYRYGVVFVKGIPIPLKSRSLPVPVREREGNEQIFFHTGGERESRLSFRFP